MNPYSSRSIVTHDAALGETRNWIASVLSSALVVAVSLVPNGASASSGKFVNPKFGVCAYQEVSFGLNDVQLWAAPKDNPGLKTTRGYFVDVILTDPNGSVITGNDEKEILQSLRNDGIEEYTSWLGEDESQPSTRQFPIETWRAPAIMYQSGGFAADTVIVGKGNNSGRSESRKGVVDTALPQHNYAATTNQIQAWIVALQPENLDTNAFYSLLAVGQAVIPHLEKCVVEGNPGQQVRASELLSRIRVTK